jgi:hypothetical protein
MCARTPIPCTTCGENLYWLAGRRTACLNGHTGDLANIPVPDGYDLVSRYHANGLSHVMLRTLCNHCRPA